MAANRIYLLDAAAKAASLREYLRDCLEDSTGAEELLLLEWIGAAAKMADNLGRMGAGVKVRRMGEVAADA